MTRSPPNWLRTMRGCGLGLVKRKKMRASTAQCEQTRPKDGIQVGNDVKHVQPKEDDVIWQTRACMNQPAEHAVLEKTMCFDHVTLPLHPTVAAYVGHIWMLFACSADVETALLAAMPKSYEE
mmetsp:Transcript_36412/g.71992  ORF Transcript_36412/g.71992 Transcript_36412/m.71992 type:complete len:123 (+) Transcript_36412:488-856(+)